jgi:hypothetical protein
MQTEIKMSAKPIVPGHLYQVKGQGVDLQVIAKHPCAAILIVLGLTHA